jgi:hypothetical protein
LGFRSVSSAIPPNRRPHIHENRTSVRILSCLYWRHPCISTCDCAIAFTDIIYRGAAARAHAQAKPGDAAMVTGYLGSNDRFDRAVAKFALAHTDQNARDYQSLLKGHP